MKLTFLKHIFFIVFFTSSFIFAEESWNTYIAHYEDLPGSTALRMDLIDVSPIKDYKYVLVTGIKYDSAREDGFPENKTYDLLYEISDKVINEVSKISEYILAGTFTYNYFRYDYIYIKDIQQLEKILKDFYEYSYPDFEYYINIDEDPKWEYYRGFLYPNEQTLNYMGDRDVVFELKNAGDILFKERRVDHWIYFNTLEDRDDFLKDINNDSFTIEAIEKTDYQDFPYSLQIWRNDKVDLTSINAVTSSLYDLAKNRNGYYDGWETFIVKE